MTQASQLTVERSLYPKSQLFQPKVVTVTSVAQACRAYIEVMAQRVPQTQEEAAHDRKFGWGAQDGHASDSFDDATSAWAKVGRYWVRKTVGSHPQCHTNDRLGATVNWRNGPGSYCCAGFPYFSPESMERFRRTMEMVKPLLRFRHEKRSLTVCLERDLEGPIGTCWGIRTGKTYLRFVASMDRYLEGERTPVTKVNVQRALTKFCGN